MTASPGMSYSVTTSSVLLLVVAMSATVGFTDASSSSISSSPSSYRRNSMIFDMLHKKRGGGGIDAIAAASATYEDHDCDEIEMRMDMEEECVTSFYRRVREKRRALLNGPQFDQPRSARDDDYLLDSSLDSLAAATSSSTSSSSGGDGGSSMARSVRGGGGGTSSRRPRLLSSSMSSSTSLWGMPSGGRHHREEGGGHRTRSPIRHDHRRRHDTNSQGCQNDVVPLRSEGDFHEELLEEEDDGEEQPHHPHCLGLLRVPCSIAINSRENDDLDHNRHRQHHTKKTPVSAYVDTGAQVTVISACAAKRAGIYHLIDRRYAGRATGVGHCRVLGRIPARHVYFLLGEDENDIDNEDFDDFDGDEYQDDNSDEYNSGDAGYLSGRDFRGGGGDYTQQDVDVRRARRVQMDGPALTVLEGTVTKGVDVLLGLDVLQDWEAEIRMGPSRKSITVREKNRRGFGGPSKVAAVIPFATAGAASAFDGRSRGVAGSSRGLGGSNVDMHTRTGSDAFCRPSSELDTPPTASTYHDQRRHRHGADESLHSQDNTFASSPNFNESEFQHFIDDMEDDSEDYDDFFFSPASSDVESDLDLLDQSGHEFPDDGERRRTRSIIYGGSKRNSNSIRSKLMEDDDVLLSAVGGGGGGRSIDMRDTNDEERVEVDDVNEDEDYLQDDDEEDNITIHGEEDEKIDMSGL